MSKQNQIKDFPQNSCRANNSSNYEHGQFYNIEPLQDLHTVKGTIMKIRSMQTCIMSSLPRCIFRCSVFRYVTLDIFFKLCYLIVISFTLVANKYLLTYQKPLR